MDLSQLGLFNGLMGKMDWLIQRQKVVATNIANENTPDYQAMDIAPFSFKSMMKRLSPTATSPMHFQIAGGASGDQAREASSVRSAYEVKPDGNAVTPEQEMAKAASNAAEYQMASNIYKKTIGMIKQAIGNGNS